MAKRNRREPLKLFLHFLIYPMAKKYGGIINLGSDLNILHQSYQEIYFNKYIKPITYFCI